MLWRDEPSIHFLRFGLQLLRTIRCRAIQKQESRKKKITSSCIAYQLQAKLCLCSFYQAAWCSYVQSASITPDSWGSVLPKQHSCNSLKAALCTDCYTWAHKQKQRGGMIMYALSNNICCRRRYELSSLQNGLQLEESIWFPRPKELFLSSRRMVPEWSSYRRTRFTHWVFIFLLQISPSVCNKLYRMYFILESSDLFLSWKLFRLFSPPPQNTEMILLWWSCLHLCGLSPHTLVSSHSPKMVSIRLIGKSKLPPGVCVPKKVVCQIFLPLTRWLLGSASACPVTLIDEISGG